MAISFNDVPSNLRVPFVAVEIDSSQAAQGPALLAYRSLLIGQKLAAGTGVANTLYKVTSPEDVITLAGRGSMLHRQAIAYFAANRFTETWIAILADGAGVAASGTITVVGAATADGTIAFYMGGKRLTAEVTSGDSVTVIAAAIDAAINADLDLPVTSSPAVGVVTVTFRHLGEVGNSFDMRVNHLDGEVLPAGVTSVTVSPMASGTVNPVLTTLIAALGDNWYHVWSHPYTDATSLTAIENELTSRNGSTRMIDGVAITSAVGSFATLTSLGDGRNNRHSAIVAQPGANPLTPPMEFGAEVAGIVARYGAADPARPFQTLGMTHAVQPSEADLFTIAERNLLLFDGISTTKAVAGGAVQLGRLITTYQTNAAGAADTAYLDLTTMLTLLYLRFSFRNRMQTKYPRHKLANDGTRFGPGQAVITPKLGAAEAIGWFRQMETLGLVEGFEQFKADLVVERNSVDVNRLDFLLPPDLINALIVAASKIAFRL